MPDNNYFRLTFKIRNIFSQYNCAKSNDGCLYIIPRQILVRSQQRNIDPIINYIEE